MNIKYILLGILILFIILLIYERCDCSCKTIERFSICGGKGEGKGGGGKQSSEEFGGGVHVVADDTDDGEVSSPLLGKLVSDEDDDWTDDNYTMYILNEDLDQFEIDPGIEDNLFLLDEILDTNEKKLYYIYNPDVKYEARYEKLKQDWEGKSGGATEKFGSLDIEEDIITVCYPLTSCFRNRVTCMPSCSGNDKTWSILYQDVKHATITEFFKNDLFSSDDPSQYIEPKIKYFMIFNTTRIDDKNLSPIRLPINSQTRIWPYMRRKIHEHYTSEPVPRSIEVLVNLLNSINYDEKDILNTPILNLAKKIYKEMDPTMRLNAEKIIDTPVSDLERMKGINILKLYDIIGVKKYNIDDTNDIIGIYLDGEDIKGKYWVASSLNEAEYLVNNDIQKEFLDMRTTPKQRMILERMFPRYIENIVVDTDTENEDRSIIKFYAFNEDEEVIGIYLPTSEDIPDNAIPAGNMEQARTMLEDR